MVTQRQLPTRPVPFINARAGRQIVHQGDPDLAPHVVSAGALLATTVLPDGQVLACDVLGPGDLVGDASDQPAASSVRALTGIRLRPAVDDELASLLSRRANRLVDLACELAWRGVTDRVEHRLADLAARFGEPEQGGIAVRLALTQEDLAALCGTSRESTNRALRTLQHRQRVWVRGRGYYVVGVPSCSRIRLHVLQ